LSKFTHARTLYQETVGQCKALNEFQGESVDELSFSVGETIVTTGKVNDEWLLGRIGSREGMFPAAFVEILKEIPAPSAAPAQKTSQQPRASAAEGNKKPGELFAAFSRGNLKNELFCP